MRRPRVLTTSLLALVSLLAASGVALQADASEIPVRSAEPVPGDRPTELLRVWLGPPRDRGAPPTHVAPVTSTEWTFATRWVPPLELADDGRTVRARAMLPSGVVFDVANVDVVALAAADGAAAPLEILIGGFPVASTLLAPAPEELLAGSPAPTRFETFAGRPPWMSSSPAFVSTLVGNVSYVPEPGTAALFGIGGVLLAGFVARRRQRRRSSSDRAAAAPANSSSSSSALRR